MNKTKLLKPAASKTRAFFTELTGIFEKIGYDPIEPESDIKRAEVINDLKSFLSRYDIFFQKREKPIDFLRKIQKIAQTLEDIERLNFTEPMKSGTLAYTAKGGVKYIEMTKDDKLNCEFDHRGIIKHLDADSDLAKKGVQKYDQLIAAGGLTPPLPFKKSWLVKQFKDLDGIIALQFAPYDTSKRDKQYAEYMRMGWKASVEDMLKKHRDRQDKFMEAKQAETDKNQGLLQKIQQQRDLTNTVKQQAAKTDEVLTGTGVAPPTPMSTPPSKIIRIDPRVLRGQGFTSMPSIGIQVNSCVDNKIRLLYQNTYNKPSAGGVKPAPTYVSTQSLISSREVDKGELVKPDGSRQTFNSCKAFTTAWNNYMHQYNSSISNPGTFIIYLKDNATPGSLIGTMANLAGKAKPATKGWFEWLGGW